MTAIYINNITTHNLKNIDVVIPYNHITCITGVSGGGKSSLGFHTLYKLCKNEFESIENHSISPPTYELGSYKGIIPAISIEQLNRNNNPISSLYTFLNIAQVIRFDLADLLLIPFLKINATHNVCHYCNGLGVEEFFNQDKFMRLYPSVESLSSKTLPDKLVKTLTQYITDKNTSLSNIYQDEELRFAVFFNKQKLSKSMQYSANGRKRTTRIFDGIADSCNQSLSLKKIFTLKKTCSKCNGSRISDKQDVTLMGMKLSSFLITPMSELVSILPDNTKVSNLVRKLNDLGLGYLTFSRSIPSLSGGELQKIKLAKLLSSTISGVLIVIDEISAHLNPSEFHLIFNELVKLKERKNTLVLIEHNSYFIKQSNRIYNLGPSAGSKGGRLIPYMEHPIEFNRSVPNAEKIIYKDLTENNVHQQSLILLKHHINVLVGLSGSGKSSIANAIVHQDKETIFITQKAPASNYKTTIMSYLGIKNNVESLFSKTLSVCKKCSGSGIYRIEQAFEEIIEVECLSCNGKMYTKASLKYQFEQHNIHSFTSSEVDELSHNKDLLGKDINNVLKVLRGLQLMHLSLNRRLRTLSGGELNRLKLAKFLLKKQVKNKLLIIDEVGAGLDPVTCTLVMQYIQTRKKEFKSILMIEHRVEIYSQADQLVHIGPKNGNDGGKVIAYLSPSDYFKQQ